MKYQPATHKHKLKIIQVYITGNRKTCKNCTTLTEMKQCICSFKTSSNQYNKLITVIATNNDTLTKERDILDRMDLRVHLKKDDRFSFVKSLSEGGRS